MGVAAPTLKIESKAGPLHFCRRGHALMSYYGEACPLCQLQAQLEAAQREILRLVEENRTVCRHCKKGR